MDSVYHDMHHKVSRAGLVGEVTGGVLLRSCWLCSGCVFPQPRCVAAAGWVCVCVGGSSFRTFIAAVGPTCVQLLAAVGRC